MNRFILDDIPVTTTLDDVLAKLAVTEEEDIDLVRSLYEKAKEIARPKVVYKIVSIDEIKGDKVVIDGITFTSEVLAKNLSGVDKAYAYVTTCGVEVDEWSRKETDFVVALWLDMIKELFLRSAFPHFFHHLEEVHGLKKYSTMGPGSGNADVWPISEQVPLFKLIGGVTEDISVTLTDSLLMLPTKSTSGIAFPSDRGYVSCALCTKEKCPGRRTEYNPTIMDM